MQKRKQLIPKKASDGVRPVPVLRMLRQNWQQSETEWGALEKSRNIEKYKVYAKACRVAVDLAEHPPKWRWFCGRNWKSVNGRPPKHDHHEDALHHVLRAILIKGPDDKAGSKDASEIASHLTPLLRKKLTSEQIFQKLCKIGVFKLPRKKSGAGAAKSVAVVTKERDTQAGKTIVEAVLELQGNGSALFSLKMPSTVTLTASVYKVAGQIRMTVSDISVLA